MVESPYFGAESVKGVRVATHYGWTQGENGAPRVSAQFLMRGAPVSAPSPVARQIAHLAGPLFWTNRTRRDQTLPFRPALSRDDSMAVRGRGSGFRRGRTHDTCGSVHSIRSAVLWCVPPWLPMGLEGSPRHLTEECTFVGAALTRTRHLMSYRQKFVGAHRQVQRTMVAQLMCGREGLSLRRPTGRRPDRRTTRRAGRLPRRGSAVRESDAQSRA